MDANRVIFKISETSYIHTYFLEETIRNKKIFLDWSSFSDFDLDSD